MHHLAKILGSKPVRYTKYILYGMVIFWNFNYLVQTDRVIQEQIAHYRQLNKDAVPDKPALQMAIPGYAWLFDGAGDTTGFIRHSVLYANPGHNPAGKIRGKVYFWVWAESVDNNQLVRDETIRDRANAYPLGELRKGTTITSYYLNEKGSWMLASGEVTVEEKYLRTFSQHVKQKRLLEPKIYVTNTNQLAGIAVLPRTQFLRETELKTSLRVSLYITVHLLILFLVYFLIKTRYRNRTNYRKILLGRFGLIALGLFMAVITNILLP